MVRLLVNRFLSVFVFLAILAGAQGQVGKWVYKAHMLTPRSEAAVTLGSDGRIYVFGGIDASFDGLDTAEVYDPSTDTWTPIGKLPYKTRRLAAVGLPDGRIFLAGMGTDGLDRAHFYDPVTDIYTAAPSINYPFDTTPAAVLGNDGNVLVLHTVPTQAGNTVRLFPFDVSANKWLTVTEPEFLPLRPAFVADRNGIAYAIGGRHGVPGTFHKAWAYDDHAHAYSEIQDMPANRTQHAGALGGDGRIYIIGGSFPQITASPSVVAYDPAGNSWSDIASLQTARQSHVAVNDGSGRIYAIGGTTVIGADTFVLDSVECYQPSLLRGTGEVVASVEGSPINGKVASFKNMGPAKSPADFVASINWGDGTSSAGTVVAGSDPLSFRVEGAHTYTDVGDYSTTIKIDAADGDTLTLSNGVAQISDALIEGNAVDFNATTNVAFNGVLAKFTDGYPGEVPGEMAVTVDWGDGSAIDIGTIVSNGAGFDVKGKHTYAAMGSYTVKVTLGNDTTSLVLIGTGKVTPPAPPISPSSFSATEGSLFSGAVATFTSGDPSLFAANFTATIEWGDGSSGPGFVAAAGAGFVVSGSHTYSLRGTYPVKVSVAVTGGASSTATGQGNVADAPLSASGFDLTVKGTNFSDTVASFTDANPAGTAGEFGATIFWGDGKSSTGVIVAAGGGFKVVGSHAYAKKARFTVTVAIRSTGGSTASATTKINVGPVK